MKQKSVNSIFLFRISWWERMKTYLPEEIDELMNSIIQYVEKGSVVSLQGEPGILFEEICRTLDSDSERMK